METYTFPHFQTTIRMALFKHVKNAASLRARLIAASTMQGDEGVRERAAINFAFIDARLITSRLALETAIHQALLSEEQGILNTKYVHSEILYILNPSSNITEAIRRFGVSDTATSLVVVSVTKDKENLQDESVESAMKSSVDGELVPMDSLREITDWAVIKKYYKLGSDSGLAQLKSEEASNLLIDRIVTNIIAIKPVAS